jgi:hypothetical protein
MGNFLFGTKLARSKTRTIQLVGHTFIGVWLVSCSEARAMPIRIPRRLPNPFRRILAQTPQLNLPFLAGFMRAFNQGIDPRQPPDIILTS